MVSTEDAARWQAFGGKINESKGRKTYVAPSGKTLRSWKEAERMLASDAENNTGAKEKRPIQPSEKAAENPSKKVKTQEGDSIAEDAKEQNGKHSNNDGADDMQCDDAGDNETKGGDVKRASKRSAGQNIKYEDHGPKLPSMKSQAFQTIVVKEEPCESEEEALKETIAADKGEASVDGNWKRRMTGFSVVNKEGQVLSVQRIGLDGCENAFLTGAIYPTTGKMTKDLGRAVSKIGPVTKWHVRYFGAEPTLFVNTATAEYSCSKPSAEYRPSFNDLAEQMTICYNVVQALKGKDGGTMSFEAILAQLARSKVVKGYTSMKECLLLNGSFILSQLPAMQTAVGAGCTVEDCEFVKGLREELKNGPPKTLAEKAAVGITFRDPSDKAAGDTKEEHKMEVDTAVAADEEYARRLQAKMDAAEYATAQRGGQKQKAGTEYIKISEEEIADDYPMPKQYVKEHEEMDELMVNGDEDMMLDVDPQYLPTQIIDNFSAYNAEGFLSTLELLPMWQNVDPDVDLFASGVISELNEEDSEWAAGHALSTNGPSVQELDAAGAANGAGCSKAGASAGGSSAAAPAAADDNPAGMRVYLSQIKEWMVEYSCDMCFISVRTDCAWYRIRSVDPRYAPWFDVVLKAARLALHILGMLQEESRSSKLSFADIVKRLAAQDAAAPTYLSGKVAAVERFVVVHGQIILNQFRNFPIKAIQKCAFVTGLQRLMADRKHAKLYMSKKRFSAAPAKGRKLNPMRDRNVVSRPKPMTATATNLVKSVWIDYFNVADGKTEQDENAPKAEEVEDDENAEDDPDVDENAEEAVEQALTETAKPCKVLSGKKSKRTGKLTGQLVQSRKAVLTKPLKALPESARPYATSDMFAAARVGVVEVELGDVIELEDDDDDCELPLLGLVQAIWHDGDVNDASIQVRVMVRGEETVLGDAASSHELFLTTVQYECPLAAVQAKCNAVHLQVPHGPGAERAKAMETLENLIGKNKELAEKGEPIQLLYRMLYLPHDGMFKLMPADLKLGSYMPPEVNNDGVTADDGKSFVFEGHKYSLGDFVYTMPLDGGKGKAAASSDDEEDEETENKGKGSKSRKAAEEEAPAPNDPRWLSKYHARDLNTGKGDLSGLYPYIVAQIVGITTKNSEKGKSGKDCVSQLKMRRFVRAEEISQELSYKDDLWSVYSTETNYSIAMSDLRGRCVVVLDDNALNGQMEITGQMYDVFKCAGSFKNGKVAAKPKSLAVKGGTAQPAVRMAESSPVPEKADDGVALRTLDIFAGCGGLSEGMHQARAAVTKWAIEYEKPAADAFQLNNADAVVYNANCNVILHRAMAKAGAEADCRASEAAIKESADMAPEVVESLPLPGDVEFICGGPPCQGYSGMNRFNKGNWSMVQNSMVMAYLSYADFYRPRYWLLENVRNFVSHNKSFTFRLTLRTLLEMGYQVRFGVLNAGNFGVSQSRKRTFIWAAAPAETLPDWPQPLTVFPAPQLCINLPGGITYRAIKDGKHARLRATTVRDAIKDLPPIVNGDDQTEQEYKGEAVSAFQKAIRGKQTILRDHICKTMNELNLRRCSLIPKNTPGADWRSLVFHVREHPEDENFNGQKLIPWCLPNTAERHNGWRGLYGRLAWDGHFPTSVTDPNPMGKVGQVFHPEQDRIVSVRECARAQGFPDHFQFYGNVHNKHKQIGNAVPPPLACALGRMLRKRLDEKVAADQLAMLGGL